MRSSDQHSAALGQVLELTVLLNEDMTRSLARDGLTGSRVRVLWHIHLEGPSTQRALAQALEVSPRNITGLVDGLVETGFVTRQPHPTDRRATLVSTTPRGSQVTERLAKDREQLAALLFAGMPAAQFDGLVEGLTVVLTQIKKELAARNGGDR